jgi:hypothetical protein
MVVRPGFKLVAFLAAFVFFLGAAASGAMGRPCRMDPREPAASRLADRTDFSGGGATCCCGRAEASLPAPAIAQQDRTTLTGAGAASAQALQTVFGLASFTGLIHRDLARLAPGSPIPILLITRSLLI